jgi:hypothetical protein
MKNGIIPSTTYQKLKDIGIKKEGIKQRRRINMAWLMDGVGNGVNSSVKDVI